jgi:dTDP-4-dehydrorhamnose reductase
MRNKILVLGSDGQLGTALKSILPKNSLFLNKLQCNLENFSKLKKILLRIRPAIVVNCAAYTNVDKAEDDPKKCFIVNSLSAKFLSDISEKIGFLLIYISSDFVFDGLKAKKYSVRDSKNPLNFYGFSKSIGEYFILNNFKNRSVIIRTSWVYSFSHKNFITDIISKIQANKSIYVAKDYIGVPTCANSLANFIFQVINNKNKYKKKRNVFHFTDGYTISRYKCALMIYKLMKENNYRIKATNVYPIKLREFSLKASRPKYVSLNNSFMSNYRNPLNEFRLNILKILELWAK